MVEADKALVERLEDEAARLSGVSIERGNVDAGIASNLAYEAAAHIRAQDARIKELVEENERLTGLVYCPGTLRCAKCDFRLIKTTLTPAGAFANEEPDRCPNCDVPMWRMTWKDEAGDAYGTAESQMNRAIAAERKAEAMRIELKRISSGRSSVTECALIARAALSAHQGEG